MKKFIFIILLLTLCFLSSILGENVEPVLFFYSMTCSQCKDMKSFLESLLDKNEDILIELHDVDEEIGLWEEKCNIYNIPAWGVPRIFVGDKVFAGWFLYQGDLVYVDQYYGNIGYKNQILKALEFYFDSTLNIPEMKETKNNENLQEDCSC